MSIRRRGEKYQVRVTVNGRAVTQSFDTQVEAQRWATHQKILLAHGVGVADERSKSATRPTPFTLAEAIERYRTEVLPGKRGHQSARTS
jgi:hypothetical protein